MTTHEPEPTGTRDTRRLAALVAAGIAVIVLAAGLRWLALGRGLWLDEYLSFEACCRADGPVRLRDLAAQFLPYHAGLALWARIDAGVGFVRLPSLAMGVVTVATTMVGLWRVAPRAAIMAGALLACSPLLLRYGLEIRGYGLVVAAAAVACAVVVRDGALARRTSRRTLAVAVAVAPSTHPTAWMLVPALVVADAIAHRERRTNVMAWCRGLAVPVVAAGCVTFGSAVLHRGALAQWWMPAPSLAVIGGVLRVTAGLDAIAWPFATPAMAVASALGLASLAGLSWPAVDADARRFRLGLALVAAGVCYVAGLVVVSLIFPVLWPRTVIAALVPTLGGLAVLVSSSRSRVVRVGGALAIGMVCCGWAAHWTREGAWRDVEPWREAGRRLEQAWRPGDIVVFYPDYVAGAALHYAPRIDRAAVASIRISDDAEAVAAKVAAASDRSGAAGARLLAMVRADFTVRAQERPLDHILAEAARRHGERDVYLVVLTASDVEVDPGLAAMRTSIEVRAQAALGRPTRHQPVSALLDETVFAHR
jgi:hypothetical protein